MNYFLLCAYNEEENVDKLISDIEQNFSGEEINIVFINDGSTDRTKEKIEGYIPRLPVVIINHEKNLGLGKALNTGFSYLIKNISPEDCIITLDCDNTHPLQLAKSMVKKLSRFDIVIASRFCNGGDEIGLSPLRRILSRCAKIVFRSIIGSGISDWTSGYRAYRGDIILRWENLFRKSLVEESGFTATVEILLKLLKLSPKICEVPLVLRYDLKKGKSKIKILLTVFQYLSLIYRRKILYNNSMNHKICMFVAKFFPYIGGTEQQALKLTQSLSKNNFNVFILTQRYSMLLKKYDRVDDVKVIRTFSFGNSLIFMVSSFLWLFRHYRRYDIIHAHLASSHAVVACAIAKIFNKKTVIKLAGGKKIGDIPSSLATFSGRTKLSFLKRYADAFVGVTNEIVEEMLLYGFDKEKVHMIPNGVETTIYSSDRNARNVSEGGGEITILFSGRIAKEKNLETLLLAFNEIIFSRKINARLLLLGEGPYEEKNKLTALRDELGLSGLVRFAGKVSDVKEYYDISDIFVLPSISEGLSNALLEAMSSGLAVVASNVGGNKEIIEDKKNGLLFEVGDKQDLAEKLAVLCSNKSLREELGVNARNKILKDYSIDIVTEKYIRLYNEITYSSKN